MQHMNINEFVAIFCGSLGQKYSSKKHALIFLYSIQQEISSCFVLSIDYSEAFLLRSVSGRTMVMLAVI